MSPPRPPRRRSVAAFALAAVAACGWFSPGAASARQIEFTEYDLPNGLHVILSPDHTVPVVSSYVLYHVGSKNERFDRTGFAHFFEHLMFEGSDNIARGQLDKLVTGAGGSLNASTSFDRTDFFLNLPANHLGLALWIESERMWHGKVEQIGVDTQRQVVKEERRRSYDNQPYGSLFEELAKLVFAGSPYAWVPIGSVQYIDKATLEEFRDFYHTFYLPNNAVLTLAGDFDPAEARTQIEQYFGPIPRGPEPPRPKIIVADPAAVPPTAVTRRGGDPANAISEFVVPDSSQPGNSSTYTLYGQRGVTREIEKQNTPLPATLHAWLAPKENDPDARALELLTDILANGRSSRLYRRMVDGEQVAIQATAFPYFLEDGGMVGVFAVGLRGTTLEKLDTLMDEEVATLRKDGVTEEELQKARNQKEAELANSYATNLARARGLADAHVFYGSTDAVNHELDLYLQVTREDLQRVANKYLAADRRDVLHYPVPAAAAK